jgi:hypothetical protein
MLLGELHRRARYRQYFLYTLSGSNASKKCAHVLPDLVDKERLHY